MGRYEIVPAYIQSKFLVSWHALNYFKSDTKYYFYNWNIWLNSNIGVIHIMVKNIMMVHHVCALLSNIPHCQSSNTQNPEYRKLLRKINISTLLFTVYRIVQDHNRNSIKGSKNVYTKIQNGEKTCSWCYLVSLITMCMYEMSTHFLQVNLLNIPWMYNTIKQGNALTPI